MIQRVLDQLRPAKAASLGPGDDCAVLTSTGDLVVTSDTMIEGPDFRLAWHSGYELGWKLAATNLSDVASMGARATALTVSFACPSDTPVDLLSEISRGLDAACAELAPGCGVIGGDLSRAPLLFAAVTAMGDLEGRTPVTRSAARAGDVVAYAGDLGLAGLGLAILFSSCVDADGEAQSTHLPELRNKHSAALSAQFAPTPPIHLGIAASIAGATAMMDVSDGLALDSDRLARASRVTLDLSTGEIMRAFGTQSGVSVPLEMMLEGGEDHGLLACFPSGAELPDGFRHIGTVRERQDAPVQVDGQSYAPRGWDPYTEFTPALMTSEERQ